MSILLLDPTGAVATTERRTERKLDGLIGKKVGYIFNQHASALGFWKALEQAVEAKFKPSAVHRVYKENTWAPAPTTAVDRLTEETDYVLVGLGA